MTMLTNQKTETEYAYIFRSWRKQRICTDLYNVLHIDNTKAEKMPTVNILENVTTRVLK